MKKLTVILLFMMFWGCNEVIDNKMAENCISNGCVAEHESQTNVNTSANDVSDTHGAELNVNDTPEVPNSAIDREQRTDSTNQSNDNSNDESLNKKDETSAGNDSSASDGTDEQADEGEDSSISGEDSSLDNCEECDDIESVTAMEADGLPNLFRVSEELYRSGQPVTNGLKSAKTLGIQTVLSLQIVSLDELLEGSEQSGLVLENVSMVPTTVSIDNIVDALKVINNASKPVLVHCLHGSDRTGVTVAMYRMVFQNWPKEKAKQEMLEERFGYHSEFENLLELIDTADVDEIRRRVLENTES